MLKINTNFKKYKIPILTILIPCIGLILLSYLTFIPTPTSAIDTIDPNETRTLMQIDTMQEMTEQICTNTKENRTKQLKDARDSKIYWVAKLKDGNCWMTQNLDYDGGGATAAPTAWTNSWENATYYDPGNYVYTAPSEQIWCNVEGSAPTTLVPCANEQFKWVNVEGKEASKDPNYDIEPSAIEYNSHYHIGNYYSWMTATAGSGTNSLANAPSSICPNHWMLPKAGNNSYNTSGSFAYLLRQYNLATSDTNGTLISKTNAIYNHPLYFLPGGRIQNQKINAIGSAGYFWSSLGGGSSAYTLFMNSTVDPSHSFNTYNGMAIRCLIKGGWLPNGGLDEPLDANQANLSITVSPVISIDATSGMNEAVDFTTVANGNITATVSSNQAYQVLLSTNQSTLEQNPIVTNQSIPMISTDANITAGTRAWGIKKTNSALSEGTLGDTTANTLFSPIGTNENKVLFYKSANAESRTLTFPVAISVDSTLTPGTYSTMVTITAVGI